MSIFKLVCLFLPKISTSAQAKLKFGQDKFGKKTIHTTYRPEYVFGKTT